MNSITLDTSALEEMESILKKVEIMDRHKALKKGLRKGANVFKKRYQAILPRQGAPDDRGHTPLAKSVRVKIIGSIAIIGESQKDKKHYHAHLVGEGFDVVRGGRVVGRYEGRKYGTRAAAASLAEIQRAMVDGVNEAVRDLT